MSEAGTKSSGKTAPPPDEKKTDAGGTSGLDYGDDIDRSTFEQILEMDDDDPSQDFSKSIVFSFFDQAETTFSKMERALDNRDLQQLSSLGHFLKGSSATLGLTKVKDGCEKIQNYGSHRDETGAQPLPDDDVCLERIRQTLAQVKKDYAVVNKALEDYYGEREAQ